MTSAPSTQIPGIYRRRIGDIIVTAISDGTVQAKYDMMRVIDAEGAEALLKAAHVPAPPLLSVNCFVIHSAGRVGIIDTGCGTMMTDQQGKLFANLKLAGVDIADIDTVMLTHMHPDHSNGLTAENGTANFPNAELVVSETDVKHWHDDAAMSIASARHQDRFFMGARFQIVPYVNRRRDAVGEVFPGVHAVPLPGHTPGHTGYMVQSGSQQLFIWGDIFHIPDVQVPRPDVFVDPDSDGEQAVATRLRTFDMVTTDQLLVAGMHMHFPGFLRMSGNAQKGYQVHAENWQQDL
jgi:glyoxylase-like metal-dependent hydrolase (beta-lactamase superfamily II)